MPRAKIVGPSNIQVPKGSTISLTCSVDLQASLILWWAINYVKTNCLSHSRFLLHFFLSPFFVTFASYKILLSSFYSFLPSLLLVRKRYHNSTIVDYTRGGINLENEKSNEGMTSRLLLTRANFKDTGNYTCVASHITDAASSQTPLMIIPDSVSVKVL